MDPEPVAMPSKILITLCATCGLTVAQESSSVLDLARQLADDSARAAAIDRIAADGGHEVPLLLSLAAAAPRQVDENQLDIGLADAFGKLKVTDAIPFLLSKIRLQRRPWDFQSWLRAPQVVITALPAVAALIHIGPPASKALMRLWNDGVPQDSRLPIIFVIAQIATENPDDSETERAFLSSVVGEANLEHLWAEEGLKSKPR